MWLPMIQSNLKVRLLNNIVPLLIQINNIQVTIDSLYGFNLKSSYLPFLPSSASVCRAAVASPGHPEPGEPPMSAGPNFRSPSVCSAQMAAVHPVQNGSGGDPVVWGCLTVLPHVTSPVVTSGPVWVLRPACIISGWTLWLKKGLLCKPMLCGIHLDWIIVCTFIILPVYVQ